MSRPRRNLAEVNYCVDSETMSSPNATKRASAKSPSRKVKLPTPPKQPKLEAGHKKRIRTHSKKKVAKQLFSPAQQKPYLLNRIIDSAEYSPMSEGNETPFEDETSAIARSAVDNYFQKGKTPQINKKKRNRRKKNKRGDDSTNVEVATEEDDEESSEFAQHETLDMGELKRYLQLWDDSDGLLPKQIRVNNEQQALFHFPRWNLLLRAGFNLLVYGLGSKRKVLEQFATQELEAFCTVTVDGFDAETNMKPLLTFLNDKLKLNCLQRRGKRVAEWAGEIGEQMKAKGKHLIILLNNIDGPSFRLPAELRALINLISLSKSHVHLVCTADHVNAMQLFDEQSLVHLRLLFCHFDTFRIASRELLCSDSLILGLNSRGGAIQHSLASLGAIWTSLPENSQKILRLFYALFFAQGSSVAFYDLFEEARRNFFVSTDVALRQQIIELSDHHIIRLRRAEDGTEKLTGVVERDLIESFLTLKGLTLAIDDDE